MTTYYDFIPNAATPFQFQPTLDGQVYTAIVTWNLFGQRWYLNLFDLAGNRILTIAMVGSPLDYDISLVAGLFASTLVYRVQNRQIEVNP